MLNRAVFAHRTPFSRDPEKTLQTAFAALRAREGLTSGDRVVVLSDVLLGQGGDDTLWGGAGTDRLEGGAGDDVYVFTAGGGPDSVAGQPAGWPAGWDDGLWG